MMIDNIAGNYLASSNTRNTQFGDVFYAPSKSLTMSTYNV